MKPNDIICPTCQEVCGKFYPATDVDPGFREGKGEEFADEFLNWHCSQACLDVANEYNAEHKVMKQCICGHTWRGTIQDENCPICNPIEGGEIPQVGHPVDLLAGRIRGEGYHTRIESYREAAIRLYDQDAHTTAEYAKEVMLHAVTKHELKQAQDWMAENS